jgi:predicted DNA-binding transcriptional regulator YafY
MKNVFKRCLKLISLFEGSNKSNLDSNYIKDNISDYRELTDGAFKRSFERDKAILKEIGFNLEYENDKWNLNDGYSLNGTNIINDLQKKSNFDIKKFINTFSVIRKYLSQYFEINKELKIIPKLNDAIRDRRRVSFLYKDELRKVYPLGLRFYTGKWYLGAEDEKVVKTFKINNIGSLKVGNKKNLHSKNLSEFTFSWEDSSREITVELLSDMDLHKIHNTIFNYSVLSSKEIGNNKKIKLKTKDHHGLIKYLLLTESKIVKLPVKDKNLLQEVLNGF